MRKKNRLYEKKMIDFNTRKGWNKEKKRLGEVSRKVGHNISMKKYVEKAGWNMLKSVAVYYADSCSVASRYKMQQVLHMH